MGPKDTSERVSDMFRQPLIELLNPRYELVRLAAVMDWRLIEASFSKHFASTTGRPALSPRLVAGLLYLQHVYDCSDEVAVNTWVENPYWQHYTGETYFQTEAPIDPSSLTRWRKRVGEEGVETMLMATIEAGRKLGLLKQSSIDRVIEDTTVMPKAIAHPTDSRLLEKSRQHLVALAKEEGLTLRQNYNREAPRLAAQIGCYAHAKQYRRMKKSLRTLRWRVGRVMRDVGRQIERIDPSRQNRARYIPSKANRILTQKTQDKNKLYAFHAREVECIAQGKARTLYEFDDRTHEDRRPTCPQLAEGRAGRCAARRAARCRSQHPAAAQGAAASSCPAACRAARGDGPQAGSTGLRLTIRRVVQAGLIGFVNPFASTFGALDVRGGARQCRTSGCCIRPSKLLRKSSTSSIEGSVAINWVTSKRNFSASTPPRKISRFAVLSMIS
jgi:hypothetical protein